MSDRGRKRTSNKCIVHDGKGGLRSGRIRLSAVNSRKTAKVERGIRCIHLRTRANAWGSSSCRHRQSRWFHTGNRRGWSSPCRSEVRCRRRAGRAALRAPWFCGGDADGGGCSRVLRSWGERMGSLDAAKRCGRLVSSQARRPSKRRRERCDAGYPGSGDCADPLHGNVRGRLCWKLIRHGMASQLVIDGSGIARATTSVGFWSSKLTAFASKRRSSAASATSLPSQATRTKPGSARRVSTCEASSSA